MKSLMISSAVLVAVLFGPITSAQAMDPAYQASLRVVQIDPALPFARSATGASVLVAPSQRKLILSIHQKSSCSPQDICIDLLPKAASFQLTLAAPTVNACNVRIYRARNHRRTHGQPRVEITVMDYSQNQCATPEKALTRVLLTTQDAVTSQITQSEFDGDELIPHNITPL